MTVVFGGAYRTPYRNHSTQSARFMHTRVDLGHKAQRRGQHQYALRSDITSDVGKTSSQRTMTTWLKPN